MAEQRTLDAERARAIAEEDAYPHPGDNPHASVHTRYTDRSLAFRTGWAAALAYVTKADVARRAPPALDEKGLPELPEPVDTLAAEDGFNVIGEQGVYTAEQVRQAQRDAVAADRLVHDPRIYQRGRMAAIKDYESVVADLRAQLASTRQAKEYEQRHAAESEVALAKVHAQLARQSAPEGAPVACEHKCERTTHWDYIRCSDCGAVKTDSSWGIAKNQWFKDKDEAEFYKKTGARPAAPTSASAHPAEGAEHASHNKEKN